MPPWCGWRRARPLPPGRRELDVDPKDGKVSIDELAEALRPILGPFRLQFRRQGVGRTDALFDQLDRDKDGQLSRSELAAIAGSLRPLDLDDDEMIAAYELEPFNNAAFTAMMDESSDRRARFTALPPVVELVAGESSLRPARVLLKKYDKPAEDEPGEARQQAVVLRVRHRPGRLRQGRHEQATARWTRMSCDDSSRRRRST